RSWRADGLSSAEWNARHEHVPTSRVAAAMPVSLPSDLDDAAAPGVAAGLQRIHHLLSKHPSAANAAKQIGLATQRLLEPIAPGASLSFATALSRTELVAWLIDEIRRDPERCSSAYQRAVAAHPEAGVAALGEDELPLWLLDPTSAKRQRVSLSQLATTP